MTSAIVDEDEEEMRTWLRLELEDGLVVSESKADNKLNDSSKQMSDLETSGGIPSSNSENYNIDLEYVFKLFGF